MKNQTVCIFATLDDEGEVHASAYNGSWSNIQTVAASIGTNNVSRGFDVAFENARGWGLVITANNTDTPYYQIWYPNNATWSGVEKFQTNDSCGGIPLWVEAASRPNNNEIIMAYHDDTGRYCGYVWSGSSWGIPASFYNATGSITRNTKTFCVAYEESSGDGEVIFPKENTTVLHIANYTDPGGGRTWQVPSVSAGSGSVRIVWLSCPTMAASNRTMAAYTTVDGGGPPNYALSATEWNGTAFTSNATVDSGIGMLSDRPLMDSAYIGTSGSAMVAYADTQNVPSYSRCLGATGCSNGTTGWTTSANTTSTTCGATAGNVDLMRLVSDFTNNDTMLVYSTQQANEPICSTRYDGNTATWSSAITFEDTNRLVLTARPFDIAFFNSPPVFWWTSVNKTNSSEFNPTQSFQFFANFSDDNGTVEVNLTFQNTNYTMTLWNGTNTNGTWNYNVTGRGVGTYYYNFTAIDGAGATTSQTYSLVVATNTTQADMLLNGTDDNLTITYPQSVNASGSCKNTGGVQNLFRNGTTVTNPQITTLAAGYYNYTMFCISNTNYTNAVDTHFLTVAKGSIGITALLDGAAGDRAYTAGAIINASAWKNVTSEGNLTLYRNGTSVDFDSQYVEEANQTSTVTQTFNYTSCFPEAQNYSAACVTRLAIFEITGGGGDARGHDVYIGGGSQGTPTPTPSPKPPVVKEKKLDASSKVTGTFSLSKTIFSLSYTAGRKGFKGDLAWTLPFDYVEYLSGKISITPQPSRTSEGSVVAVWEDLVLKPFEKFTVTVSLNKKTDDKILNGFTILTFVKEEPPKIKPKYATPPAETPGSAGKTLQSQATGQNLIYALVIAILLIALVSYALGARKRKGL